MLKPLRLVRREFQSFAVAPEDGWLRFQGRFEQHLVQVHYLVDASIANDQEKRSVVGLHAVLNQNANAFVYFLFHFFFDVFID